MAAFANGLAAGPPGPWLGSRNSVFGDFGNDLGALGRANEETNHENPKERNPETENRKSMTGICGSPMFFGRSFFRGFVITLFPFPCYGGSFRDRRNGTTGTTNDTNRTNADHHFLGQQDRERHGRGVWAPQRPRNTARAAVPDPPRALGWFCSE